MTLRDTGQDSDPRWQLRNDEPATDWQPVEYSRPTPAESNWILPSLVGIVLVAVAGYMVYIGLNRLSNTNIALLPAQDEVPSADDSAPVDTAGSDAEPVVAVVEQQATDTPVPTVEPTATPDAAEEEPLVEPTLSLVEQQVAVITNQYGVNARLNPDTGAEVLRILETGETAIILDRQASNEFEGDWLQVQTSEGAIVWISSQFVDVESQLLPGEPVVSRDAVPELNVRVTISSPAGLNARAEPDSASDIIALLDNDTSYSALSRSEDGQWIEVALEDGSTAWIFLQLVIAESDLGSLPVFNQDEPVAVSDEAGVGADQDVTDPEPVVEASEEVTGTVDLADSTQDGANQAAGDVASTDIVTDAAAIEVPVGSPEGSAPTEGDESASLPPDLSSSIEISITSPFGVNARSTNSTDGEILTVLAEGTTVPLRGRNDDSSWLQVVLEDGTLAWVFTQAVGAPEGVDELTVYQPPAVGAPAETLEQAAAESADEPATVDAPAEETAGEETTGEETTGEGADATADEGTESTVDEGSSGSATTGVTATISSFLGAKARPAPTTEQTETATLVFGDVFDAVGRSEDGEWVQVDLSDNELAWVLIRRVELSVPLDDLPVTE